jgi:predicted RNA-binding protein with PUA-like domain
MAFWLFKQEPECYSYDDLAKDGETLWDGVSNALARKNLRTVQLGDRVLYYHTGKEKAIVGEMEVISEPTTDPNSDDPKSVVVKVKAVTKFDHPLTLAEIKADKGLAKWDLVRLPRLSVIPITQAQWDRIMKLLDE